MHPRSPRKVFDDPNSSWDFLTSPLDDNFEGQHFERKLVSKDNSVATKGEIKNCKEHIKKAVSAFANNCREGGLLVLGISSTGEVVGIDHLDEAQKNTLTNISELLRNHAAEVKFHTVDKAGDNKKTICLIFSAFVESAICETLNANPQAWTRNGSQSIQMTAISRERTCINKGIRDVQNTPHSPFTLEDVDQEVLNEFKSVYMPETTHSFSDERILREAGAIVEKDDKYYFTQPGLLFFASNPQKFLSHAFLRLMKFLVHSQMRDHRGNPSFDKDFRGPVSKQIRAARVFLRETSFFERFQFRKVDGGFIDQPEFPAIAIDEAIVNAIAHRDYGIQNPIECEYYSDQFVVKNPGRIVQRNVDLPDIFKLESTILDSMPRNRKLVEWLRLMRDSDGKAFVQSISEGTKSIAREMNKLDLPSPTYKLMPAETILVLESLAEKRKAAFLASIEGDTTSFINLFPLEVETKSGEVIKEEIHLVRRDILAAIEKKLKTNDWFIDKHSFGRIQTHKKGVELPIPRGVRQSIRFYPGYSIQAHFLNGNPYISIDYKCQVLNILKIDELQHYFNPKVLTGLRCVAFKAGTWQAGKVISIVGQEVNIQLFKNNERIQVFTKAVIPNLSLTNIEALLQMKRVPFDLFGTIKTHSLISEIGAARIRAEKIQKTIDGLAETIFPIRFNGYQIEIIKKAVKLSQVDTHSKFTFSASILDEPVVEFRNQRKDSDVREGITKFGSFDNNPHNIHLIPICLEDYVGDMNHLIKRLNEGSYKYRGAEKTFSTRFKYLSAIPVAEQKYLLPQVKELLDANPEWKGDKKLNRLFLIHTPKSGFALDDEMSPYYLIKRFLLEAGVPCQMVDSKTLMNPDFKDLNLALNITAKCGITPWVLPENVPDADFFIGLSYTQSRGGQKVLGFANVFNSYGKWEFYTGNTVPFEKENRAKYLANLSSDVLKRLKAEKTLPAQPNIIIHHSVRISKEDYKSILNAVHSISENASVTFIWINSHNNFRLFDSRAEYDGSIRRGSYISLSGNKLLLSTTGFNSYRKFSGTPRPLEVSATSFPMGSTNSAKYDQRSIAIQVLNLTKLNWASTDSFTSEPITIKFASDIAYLTAAFLRQGSPFKLHNVLENTPWFL